MPVKKKTKSEAKTRRRTMSDDHKSALAEGRAVGGSVRHYLEALDANQPKRGRKRTAESVTKRLEAIDLELAGASAIKRLNLLQEQSDLRAELDTVDDRVDISALEEEFVQHAAAYSATKGISYKTWRSYPVSSDVLKRAGIGR